MVSVKVEDIQLPSDMLKERVTVALVQIKSPFWDEVNESIEGGRKVLLPKLEEYEKRNNKIDKILDELSNINNTRKIDIIVFPEYSFFEGMIESMNLEERAKSMETIIVGNYYLMTIRKSKTFVIFPKEIGGKITYETEKISASNYDKDYLDYDDSEKELHRFTWEADGTDVYTQIFTCKDFIIHAQNSRISDITKENGILIVPMHTPKLEEFRDRIRSLIKEGLDNRVNIIGLFTNATGEESCGNTQIYAVTGSEQISDWQLNMEEGILLADIYPSRLVFRVPPLERPNSVVEQLVLYEFRNGRLIEELGKNITPGKAINPELLKEIDISRVYGFFRLPNYYDTREGFKKCFVNAYGLFGFHDILVYSYENSGDHGFAYLKLRLPDVRFEDFGGFRIGEVIKFRNKQLYEIEKSGVLKLKSEYESKRLENTEYIENIKHLIGKFFKRKISNAEMDKLKEMDVLIDVKEGEEYGDLSEEDKKNDKSEYLIFIKVLAVGPIVGDKVKFFNARVLRDLIPYNQIKTIEKVNNYTGDFSDFDYVFHVVVDDLVELADIMIKHIYKKSFEEDIQVSTRVNLMAEDLSKGGYEAFFETRITEFVQHRKLIRALTLQSAFDDPFAVKRLDERKIGKIVGFYSRCEESNLFRGQEINDFIYGIATSILKMRSSPDIIEIEQNLFRYCQSLLGSLIIYDFEKDLGRELEKGIRKILRDIDEDDFVKLINQLNSFRRGKFGPVDTLKDFFNRLNYSPNIKMQFVLTWNKNICESPEKFKDHIDKLEQSENENELMKGHVDELYGVEGRSIMESNLTDLIKRIQENKGVEIRNWLSHFGAYVNISETRGSDLGMDSQGRRREFRIDSVAAIMKLIDVADLCLEFIFCVRQS